MQYKVYKIILFIWFLGGACGVKAQVYGGNFYLTYDRSHYDITAYGIDNNSLENNEKLKLNTEEIRGVSYDKINFISFQNDKNNIKLKGKQFYETIALQITGKNKKNEVMLVFITGRFDDRLNYELKIDFEEGSYIVFIPISEKAQLNLENSYIAGGCKKITELITPM
ncbi:hypothetical protein [Aequorivita sp. CIP111184]|uniref:hypothetical protein n=1 Tax=Aequorivita sp. CIP111184 TaxID=2211356 RepID=UPI000DBBE0DC|nr:hypothetical protein [Aequorivita sp. CIP111184]SRX56067.1 hypothetical protein AEQU1_03093 [Aequorivita sp. CIP111184]